MNVICVQKPKSAPFRCFEDDDDMFVEPTRNLRLSGTFVPSDAAAAVAAVAAEFVKPLPPLATSSVVAMKDENSSIETISSSSFQHIGDGGGGGDSSSNTNDDAVEMDASSDVSIEKIDLIDDTVEVVSSDLDD